jgi:hypothetical protein
MTGEKKSEKKYSEKGDVTKDICSHILLVKWSENILVWNKSKNFFWFLRKIQSHKCF